MPDVRILDDRATMTEVVEQYVIAAYQTSPQSFSLVLSGGSTPLPLYERLAQAEEIDWHGVNVFWGDERAVPPDHPDSNYRMAKEALLDHVPLPLANVHRIPAEFPPDEAALHYEQTVNAYLGAEGRFDLVLLGMGDDGHTASLFPETAALDETQRKVVANYVPKAGTWRITMTAPLINRARRVVFLVAGEDKAASLREVLSGLRQPRRFPSQLIAPDEGELVWFADRAAASQLES